MHNCINMHKIYDICTTNLYELYLIRKFKYALKQLDCTNKLSLYTSEIRILEGGIQKLTIQYKYNYIFFIKLYKTINAHYTKKYTFKIYAVDV